MDARAGLVDLLSPGTVAQQSKTLALLTGPGLTGFPARFSDFEFALSGHLVGSQFLLAIKFQLLTLGFSFRQGQRGLSLGNLFHAGSCLQLGEDGLGLLNFGAAERNLLGQIRLFQPRDYLPCFDILAFGHFARLDSPGELETGIGLGDLDVAGNVDLAALRGGRARVPEGYPNHGAHHDERRCKNRDLCVHDKLGHAVARFATVDRLLPYHPSRGWSKLANRFES